MVVQVNTFEYEKASSMGTHWYKWTLTYNGYCIKGEANTINAAYRKGKRALKKYKKMEKRLNG